MVNYYKLYLCVVLRNMMSKELFLANYKKCYKINLTNGHPGFRNFISINWMNFSRFVGFHCMLKNRVRVNYMQLQRNWFSG